jgi:hypothetical protein
MYGIPSIKYNIFAGGLARNRQKFTERQFVAGTEIIADPDLQRPHQSVLKALIIKAFHCLTDPESHSSSGVFGVAFCKGENLAVSNESATIG